MHIILQNTPPTHWLDWLKDAGFNAGFCQTPMWDTINVQINQKKSHYLLLHEDTNNKMPLIGALFFENKKGFLRRCLRGIRRKRFGILECFDGPVFKEENLHAIKNFLTETDILAEQLQVEIIRFYGINYTLFSQSANQSDDKNRKVYESFVNHGYTLTPWETALVDLNQTELFKSFAHSARKAINNCKKQGVVVKRCATEHEFLELFLNPYFKLQNKSVLSMFKSNPQKQLWSLDKDKNYHFFVALSQQGEPLATLGTYHFNGLVTEIISSRLSSQKIPAQDLLHYEAMLFHQARGDSYFNLAGFNPDPKTDKERGIQQFKLKWNGRRVQYYMMTKAYP